MIPPAMRVCLCDKVRPNRSAFTLLEALLSLAITSTLLVALAAAFHASSQTVRNNDTYFRCTQTARLTLGQMLTEIRRADAVQVDEDGLGLQIIRPADQRSAGETVRAFHFRPASKTVALQISGSDAATPAVTEIADHIAGCKFSAVRDGTSAASPCVSIAITCAEGASTVTVTGSMSPRRSRR